MILSWTEEISRPFYLVGRKYCDDSVSNRGNIKANVVLDGENIEAILSQMEEISRRLRLGWRKYRGDFVPNKGNIEATSSRMEKISRRLRLRRRKYWGDPFWKRGNVQSTIKSGQERMTQSLNHSTVCYCLGENNSILDSLIPTKSRREWYTWSHNPWIPRESGK